MTSELEESTCRIDNNGNKFWRNKAGDLHRLDDQPARIWADGDQEWLVNGKLHRDNNLPAIICANGDQEWWVNGELHRLNGKPARIWASGAQYWWVNGVNITDKVLEWHKTNNIKYPPTTPEEEQELAVLFKLTFA